MKPNIKNYLLLLLLFLLIDLGPQFLGIGLVFGVVHLEKVVLAVELGEVMAAGPRVLRLVTESVSTGYS